MYRKASTIASKEDLEKLLQERPSRITLLIEGLDPSEAAIWEHRLNKRLSDCGCSTGAMFLFFGVAAYAIGLWLDAEVLPSGWLGRILFGLLVLVASVCIGKGVGLLWSRRQFEGTVRKLVHELTKK